MGHDEHRAPEVGEDPLERLARREIEMVRRLVEDQEVRLLDREAGQREPAALPAREHAHRSEYVVAPEQEAREHPPGVLLTEPGGRAESLHDGLVAGELGLGLGEECDARGRCAGDEAIERRQLPDQGPNERRLPRAVGADDRDASTPLDAQRRRADDDAVPVPHRKRRRLEDLFAGKMRRLEAPVVRGRGDRIGDPLEPGELLCAAAGLLRSLPRAEAVDVLLGAGDLAGLLRRGLRLRGLPVGALARVLRIPTAVFDDAGRAPRCGLERERARGHPVEEPAVVARDQDRRVLLEEEPLEPFKRREVEMVRRLVEEEEVGIVEQQAREAKTGPLATG